MLYREVIKWLRDTKLQVAKNYLRLRLESHPYYPSMLAIEDALAETGIAVIACQGSKEDLLKENKPFLAHFSINGGDIKYYKNVPVNEKNAAFEKYWTGNVMFIERQTSNGKPEHTLLLKKEKSSFLFKSIALVLFFCSIGFTAVFYGSLTALLLVATNSIGLYFSWLIAEKELGLSNSISDKICSMAKHSQCEAVLFSKGAKLFNWLSWGDVGIVYFSSALSYLFFVQTVHLSIHFFYILSLGGLIFPLYSIYYQWKVVKQWCMLCIAVLAVLGLNAGISLYYLQGQPNSPFSYNWKEAVAGIIIAIFIFCVWQLFKSMFKNSLTSLTNEIKATRLMRNPEIFNALLEKQEAASSNLPIENEAIRFGKLTAPYQLVIACNPYCGPCAKAHHAIETLYEKHPEKFSIAVRFALHSNNDEDKKVATTKEIMKAAKHKPYEAIKDWYNLFDLEKFKELHPTNGAVVDNDVEKYITWSKEAAITATPTFFINGRRLPELYSWADLAEMLGNEIND